MKIAKISPGYSGSRLSGNTPQLLQTVQHHDCPPRLRHPFEAIEEAPRIKIPQTLLPLQQDKVQQTYASPDVFAALTSFRPKIAAQTGVASLVDWHSEYSGATEAFKRGISANGAAN
ncbi:hypothetical protein ACVNHC_01880 [Pannonibacter sp. Q-1]